MLMGGRVALALAVIVAAGAARAGTDLAFLLNKSEADARSALSKIALAPNVTRGIHELSPASLSKLCRAKQLSVVEADVFLLDDTVMRVEDRRVRRALGDIEAAKAFKIEMMKQLGEVDVRDNVGGGIRLVARRSDVAVYYVIRQRPDAVFELAAEGAEIVDASAKCDQAKTKQAALDRAAEAAATSSRCRAGDVTVCARAASLADDPAEALRLARTGCTRGDVDACTALAHAATAKGVQIRPEACAEIFAARATSCRNAPTVDLCDVRFAVRGCLDYRETPSQARDRIFGSCVTGGKTRDECERVEVDREGAVAASKGDDVVLGMSIDAMKRTGIGKTLPATPYSTQRAACGITTTYRTPSGMVEFVFFDGKLAEIRRFDAKDIGPQSDDDDANRRALSAFVAPMCGKAVVREVWPDTDDGGLELRCVPNNREGRGVAVQVQDDGKMRVLVQVAGFTFEPGLDETRGKCLRPQTTELP